MAFNRNASLGRKMLDNNTAITAVNAGLPRNPPQNNVSDNGACPIVKTTIFSHFKCILFFYTFFVVYIVFFTIFATWIVKNRFLCRKKSQECLLVTRYG